MIKYIIHGKLKENYVKLEIEAMNKHEAMKQVIELEKDNIDLICHSIELKRD